MAGIDPVSNIADAAAKIISLFKADPNIKLQDQQTLDLTNLQGQIALQLQQIATDAAEAGSKSVFVAGWRPFIGWVCGVVLAYTYVLQPFLQFAMVSLHTHPDIAALPKLNVADMMPILLGLLGLGAMRSYDKQNGQTGVH
jgi:hypothetical protein